MQKQQFKIKRNKLAIAVSVAMLGGTLVGCNNENDPLAPDALGEYSILANGGTGGTTGGANGGQGGNINVYNSGSAGGAAISKRSEANTKFTRPAFTTADADLGDNPLAITADTTIDFIATVEDGFGGTVADEPYVGTDGVLRTAAGLVADYATDAIAAAGTNYLSNTTYSQDYAIYSSSGTTTADAAYTGVSVAEGATLTLGNNSGNSTRLVLKSDIDNAGTITKVPSDAYLYLYANNYIASGSVVNAGTEAEPNAGSIRIYAVNIENSGAINASGFDNAAGAGGSGDDIRLDAEGYMINSGALDSSGGDGMGAGGNADYVYLYGAYIENTANIDASGGDNTTNGDTFGDGGDGDYVRMDSDYVTYNSGDVDVSGGDGSSGGQGGCCSDTRIENSDLGEVKNSGNVNLNGGKGYTGSGGQAGGFRMNTYGGDVLNSGNLSAVGGDTVNAGSSGGNGGELYFYAYSGDNNTPAGDAEVSGDINISGGNSVADANTGSGGHAGQINVNFDGGEVGLEDQQAALLGYASIDGTGGDGYNGGRGAYIYASTSVDFIPETTSFSTGPVMSDVAINVSGGNSNSTDPDVATAVGNGGDGGEVNLYTTTDDVISHLEGVTATNEGDIVTNGGTGMGVDFGYRGGMGGNLEIDSYHGASNSGDVTANGADGGEHGGTGGYLDIYASTGEARNGGAFTANGGAGASDGGEGGWIDVVGGTGVNTGAITVNGGNATNPDDMYETTDGGDGGDVVVLGAGLDGKATNTGAISNAGGTGTQDGDEGCIHVGALSFEGDCN